MLLAGCISTTVVTESGGGLKFPLVVKTNDPGAGSTQDKPRKIEAIAFMPFINSPTFSSSGDLNVALANEQMSEAIRDKEGTGGVRLIDPLETEDRMSSLSLTTAYADVLRDYNASGLVDRDKIKKIAAKLGVDLLVQGRLEGYAVATEYDFFAAASIRWLIFDGKTGQLRPALEVEAAQQRLDGRFSNTYVKEDASLAHLGLAVTLGMHVVGWVMFIDGLESDDGGEAGVGAAMLFPVCFAPLFYTEGSRQHVSIGAFAPPESPVTIRVALIQMVDLSLKRILERYAE
jgi:hypothetical protein